MRNRDVKSITLHNKSNQAWTLRPVIDGEYWSGPDTFVVEPQQSKNYELVYRPLTMTQDSKKHNVSLSGFSLQITLVVTAVGVYYKFEFFGVMGS